MMTFFFSPSTKTIISSLFVAISHHVKSLWDMLLQGYPDATHIIVFLVLYLALIIPLLIAIAFSTLLERKQMASMQRRLGPNVVGISGLLQPIADGLKLFIKEVFQPKQGNSGLFLFAAGLGISISFYLWLFIPLNDLSILSLSLGLLFILAIQIIETYSLILAGWSSNSKYALLGALRTAAQMVSYELALSFIILAVIVFTGSFNIAEIVYFQKQSIWFVIPLFPLSVVFLISMFAETNRTPFDLPEAEAELVAGYNVEYSGMLFALFFLAEYSNMLFLSVLFSLLFLGGWTLPVIFLSLPFQTICLSVKAVIILFIFIWVRATLPRYRYDQLMDLGWKTFLPFTFAFFIFLFIVIYFTESLPLNFSNFLSIF